MDADPESWAEAYTAARARWPELPLPPAAFRAHAARLNLSDDAVRARAEDLFIVAAALEGVPGAAAGFDEYLAQAAGVATRVDRAPAFVDEVKQELRVNLLTGPDPKLQRYLATGALLDWLRVVAVRAALNMKRGDQLRHAEPVPEAVLDDHEAQQFKRWYLEDMHDALETGFGRLSAHERTLLRLHFVDALNIERIGSIYGVHRATVARWLVTIRRRLFDEMKAELATKHGLDTADVRSLYRLMERDVHISMSRILAG